MKRSWIKRGAKPMRRVSKRRHQHLRSDARRREFEAVRIRSQGKRRERSSRRTTAMPKPTRLRRCRCGGEAILAHVYPYRWDPFWTVVCQKCWHRTAGRPSRTLALKAWRQSHRPLQCT